MLAGKNFLGAFWVIRSSITADSCLGMSLAVCLRLYQSDGGLTRQKYVFKVSRLSLLMMVLKG